MRYIDIILTFGIYDTWAQDLLGVWYIGYILDIGLRLSVYRTKTRRHQS